jgi:hypothetical protein
MSSISASFAQVGVREKYLLVTSAATAVSAATTGAYTTTALDDLVTVTAFADANTASALVAAELYRDMGKTLTVYDPSTNLETEKLVLAQLMSGASTEGVSSASVVKYIRVWAADPANKVYVARVG